jgi:hypothetical protein
MVTFEVEETQSLSPFSLSDEYRKVSFPNQDLPVTPRFPFSQIPIPNPIKKRD